MTDLSKTFACLAQVAILVCAAIAPAARAEAPAIDPEAVARLKASMDYLAQQQRFSLLTSSTIEVVLESGQKLQFDNATRSTVQRPYRLHAHAANGDMRTGNTHRE